MTIFKIECLSLFKKKVYSFFKETFWTLSQSLLSLSSFFFWIRLFALEKLTKFPVECKSGPLSLIEWHQSTPTKLLFSIVKLRKWRNFSNVNESQHSSRRKWHLLSLRNVCPWSRNTYLSTYESWHNLVLVQRYMEHLVLISV